MSHGLLIRDAGGGVVIGPDTFTVRLVASVRVPAGTWGSTLRVPVPLARAGMFAAGTPLGAITAVEVAPYANTNMQYPNVGARMPAFTVGDGYVDLRPPMAGGLFDGGILMYVFTYL